MVENLIPLTSPSETGENTEGSQTQNLETATVEPQAFVEQTGNFQQSEAIQSTLTTVVNNVVATQEGTTTQGAPAGSGENTNPLVTPDAEVAVNAPANQEGTTTQGAPAGSGENTNPLVTPDAEVAINAPANQEGTTAQAAQPEVSDVSTTQETSTGGGGDTVEVVPTPPSNEILQNGEQAVGSDIGEVTEIGGLTPIQMPTPGPDDPSGGPLSTTALMGDESLINHQNHVPQGLLDPASSGVGRAGMSVFITPENDKTAMAAARESPADLNQVYDSMDAFIRQENGQLNDDRDLHLQELSEKKEMSEQEIKQKTREVEANVASAEAAGVSGALYPTTVVAGSAVRAQPGGMEQLINTSANVDLSAFTGSVEVLAVGPVGEVRAGRPSHFENRDQVQPSQDTDNTGTRGGTAPRVETMEGANRELRIEGTAAGEPEENPKASGVYAEFSPSGQAWAVDANGKSLDPGPIIKVTMGADGKEHVLAHFAGTPDGDWVELDPYTRSLSDCHAAIDRNGTVMFFDANGKALAVQPMYSEQTDSNGNLHIVAWYPGHEDEKTDMPILTHSLDGCSVQIWPDGGMSVVDSKGDWIPFQPNLTTVMGPDGKEHVYAWYPDSSDGGKVELPIYSTSLTGCTAEMKQDGKIVILDATGHWLPVQPLITVTTGADGKEHVLAWYPGGGEETKVEIPFYTTSLVGCQVEIRGPEDITVLDANGEPLLVQPIISIVLGADGKEQVFAWWPNDPEDKVLLPPYTYSPGMTDP